MWKVPWFLNNFRERNQTQQNPPGHCLTLFFLTSDHTTTDSLRLKLFLSFCFDQRPIVSSLGKNREMNPGVKSTRHYRTTDDWEVNEELVKWNDGKKYIFVLLSVHVRVTLPQPTQIFLMKNYNKSKESRCEALNTAGHARKNVLKNLFFLALSY